MIDFPANPTPGQQFTSAGITWTWDGTKWVSGGAGVAYLPLTGGTLTGALTLAADPLAPLQAATKQYADGVRWGDNRIINGDFRIDQRNNGAAGTTTGYTVDRWGYGNNTGAARGSWQRGGPGNTSPIGYPYWWAFASTSAYTPAAGDNVQLYQGIEADLIGDFMWGLGSSALPVTLSFWVNSTVAGMYGGAIRNNTPNRSYPFSFNIPTASAWTRIVITIPGDPAGTWALSGNGVGLFLDFDLGSGANFRGPANAWMAGDIRGVTGAVNFIGTNGASFNIAGVKLEVGSIATPFNRPPLAQAVAACQRYYQQLHYAVGAYAPAGGISPAGNTVAFPTLMRAAPSAVWITGPSYSNASNAVATIMSSNAFYIGCQVTATGLFSVSGQAGFNADF